MFSKILVCSDGSESAQKATSVAGNISSRFDANLTLLSVFNPASVLATFAMAPEAAPPMDVVTAVADETHTTVQRKSGSVLAVAGVPFHFLRVMGHPVEAIVEAAGAHRSELIVMGSRGLGTWSALLLGNVSEGVLHQAHCPVLIVRGAPAPFTKILLACDGSAAAFRATQAAGVLAKRYSAKLTVLTALEPSGTLARALHPEAELQRARELVATRVRGMVESSAPNEVVRRRLEQRVHTATSSDAGVDVYERQLREYPILALPGESARGWYHVLVNTDQPARVAARSVVDRFTDLEQTDMD